MKLKVQKSISARIFEVFSFIILLILPFILVWIIISSYQDKIDSEKRKQAIEEMSELTAHMFRLADPQTFLQNELRLNGIQNLLIKYPLLILIYQLNIFFLTIKTNVLHGLTVILLCKKCLRNTCNL